MASRAETFAAVEFCIEDHYRWLALKHLPDEARREHERRISVLGELSKHLQAPLAVLHDAGGVQFLATVIRWPEPVAADQGTG